MPNIKKRNYLYVLWKASQTDKNIIYIFINKKSRHYLFLSVYRIKKKLVAVGEPVYLDQTCFFKLIQESCVTYEQKITRIICHTSIITHDNCDIFLLIIKKISCNNLSWSKCIDIHQGAIPNSSLSSLMTSFLTFPGHSIIFCTRNLAPDFLIHKCFV